MYQRPGPAEGYPYGASLWTTTADPSRGEIHMDSSDPPGEGCVHVHGHTVGWRSELFYLYPITEGLRREFSGPVGPPAVACPGRSWPARARPRLGAGPVPRSVRSCWDHYLPPAVVPFPGRGSGAAGES